MFGIEFPRGFKAFNRLIICAFVVLGISFCVIIYWWILAPIVSQFFRSEDCIYHGTIYYTEHIYLNFEEGITFQNVLSELGVSEQGEIADFYYIDNFVEDNPIHGKMCDIYALDIIYQREKYLEEKKRHTDRNSPTEQIEDYTLFASLDKSRSETFVKGVAFCDETHTIRYIMITDFDTLFLLSNVFLTHSNLSWESNKAKVVDTPLN